MIPQTINDIIASFFVIAGLAFMLVGAVGIVRFPDAFNRLHASSKCSTLGLLGLLLGAVFHIGTIAVTTKAALTVLFAFVATPIGSHILAKAAHIDGLKQWRKTLSDELAEDARDRQPDDDDDDHHRSGRSSVARRDDASNDDEVGEESSSLKLEVALDQERMEQDPPLADESAA